MKRLSRFVVVVVVFAFTSSSLLSLLFVSVKNANCSKSSFFLRRFSTFFAADEEEEDEELYIAMQFCVKGGIKKGGVHAQRNRIKIRIYLFEALFQCLLSTRGSQRFSSRNVLRYWIKPRKLPHQPF